MSKSKDWIEKAIEVTEWEDVSDETSHNHHWHRSPEEEAEYDEGNMSIRMADESIESLGGYVDGYSVEIYPHPNTLHEERWHYSDDSVQALQSARAKVVSLMFHFSEHRAEKELSTF